MNAETYVDAAIATLRANLAAAIDVENAKHSDFLLPYIDPARVLFGGEDTIIAYPTVEIAIADETITGFSVGQQDWDVAESLAVKVWVQNDMVVRGYENLYRACLRYGRVVRNVLAIPNAFGDNATIDRLRVAYRANLETGDRQQFTMATLLVFQLLDVEVPD